MRRVFKAIKDVFFKRLLFYIGLITIWEIAVSLKVFPPQMFPSFFQNLDGTPSIFSSLFTNLREGTLVEQTIYSLVIIGKGMLIGLVLSGLLVAFAMSCKAGKNFVDALVAFAHPLPGIALLPLLMLWFGIGQGSIIFIIVHSVLWPMILNTSSGFNSVPRLYRDFGLNIGLNQIGLIAGIYIPASLPSIYTGLKIGWARAWRALISAEMIFGSSGASGLGWFISDRRTYNDIPAVFASLIIIVVIGIFVEDVVFNQIEKRTIRKWGMSV